MTAEPGFVTFVGAGPGDPELLTLKALRAIEAAEVVVHDRLISSDILALIPASARRIDAGKEGFGPSTPQAEIDATLVALARAGARVVRLKAGDSGVFGRLDEEIAALEAEGLPYGIVPGITSAAAAAAAIGQSFTRRGRNSGVRLVTGHDAKGFADHDWRALARPGEVAAIYMGKRAARFLAGRLLMHGAAPDTPVTAVENAPRPRQRIPAPTLAPPPAPPAAAAPGGAAILLFGLAPRAAEAVLPALAEDFA